MYVNAELYAPVVGGDPPVVGGDPRFI